MHIIIMHTEQQFSSDGCVESYVVPPESLLLMNSCSQPLDRSIIALPPHGSNSVEGWHSLWE